MMKGCNVRRWKFLDLRQNLREYLEASDNMSFIHCCKTGRCFVMEKSETAGNGAYEEKGILHKVFQPWTYDAICAGKTQ